VRLCAGLPAASTMPTWRSYQTDLPALDRVATRKTIKDFAIHSCDGFCAYRQKDRQTRSTKALLVRAVALCHGSCRLINQELAHARSLEYYAAVIKYFEEVDFDHIYEDQFCQNDQNHSKPCRLSFIEKVFCHSVHEHFCGMLGLNRRGRWGVSQG